MNALVLDKLPIPLAACPFCILVTKIDTFDAGLPWSIFSTCLHGCYEINMFPVGCFLWLFFCVGLGTQDVIGFSYLLLCGWSSSCTLSIYCVAANFAETWTLSFADIGLHSFLNLPAKHAECDHCNLVSILDSWNWNTENGILLFVIVSFQLVLCYMLLLVSNDCGVPSLLLACLVLVNNFEW